MWLPITFPPIVSVGLPHRQGGDRQVRVSGWDGSSIFRGRGWSFLAFRGHCHSGFWGVGKASQPCGCHRSSCEGCTNVLQKDTFKILISMCFCYIVYIHYGMLVRVHNTSWFFYHPLSSPSPFLGHLSVCKRYISLISIICILFYCLLSMQIFLVDKSPKLFVFSWLCLVAVCTVKGRLAVSGRTVKPASTFFPG